MKPSKIEHRGAPAIRLATRRFELIAAADFGPRIISLRSLAGGGNLMLEFPQGSDDSAGPDGFRLRGGHRLWHAPEHIVRSYQPDNGAPRLTLSGHGFTLAQATEAKTGVRKTMRIEAVDAGTIRITHTLTNEGLWAIECAPWALTMLRPGGYGVVPLLPKGDHAKGDLLPGFSIVPWSYTDLSLPVWDLHRDYIGLDSRRAQSPQKIGLTAYLGWSAYWLDGVTLVKHAQFDRRLTYPDFGCVFETFCNPIVVEMETLGALRPLAPGESIEHVEHWTLFDGLDRPSTDRAFATLARRAAAWTRKLHG